MPTLSAGSSPARSTSSSRRSFPAEGDAPDGWVRFHVLRGLADENEVITFGFFDGTREELERSQDDADYASRRAAIDPLVDTVIANGIYDIVTTLTPGTADTP